MQIIHGEQMTHSRQKLTQVVSQLKTNGYQVTTLIAKNLDPQLLEQTLGSQSLFATPQLVVIEELHSLPKSKKKDELINTLGQFTDPAGMTEIVLWEKRDLTATMLKKFPSATVAYFKASKHVFTLMEQLSPKTEQKPALLKKLHSALESDGDFFVFTMLVRQIRLLIEVKDGGRPAGPPFMVSKLQSQAKLFTLEKLLELHRRLAELDYQLKQSANSLTLSQELDLLMLSM
jgi:DNA polymerase III delta subunit